jgi:hypothetical protein
MITTAIAGGAASGGSVTTWSWDLRGQTNASSLDDHGPRGRWAKVRVYWQDHRDGSDVKSLVERLQELNEGRDGVTAMTLLDTVGTVQKLQPLLTAESLSSQDRIRAREALKKASTFLPGE